MHPTPPDAGSPLATLRQLKEMLDAGAITPQEFDALKQRLVFGAAPEATTPAALTPAPAASEATPAAPGSPAAAPSTTTPGEAAGPVAPVPPAALAAPVSEPPASNVWADPAMLPTPYLDTPAALTPEATPLLAPEPDWLAAPAPALLPPDELSASPEAEAAERRNPLNLIFALGGLLLFLGVVAYLALGHRPDEHVTSQSQTAADSAVVRPDEGPQTEQLVLTPAPPDTIRVAPAAPPTPAATVVDQASPGMDSTAAMPEAVDPTRVPATRPAPAARPAAPAAAPAADTTRQ